MLTALTRGVSTVQAWNADRVLEKSALALAEPAPTLNFKIVELPAGEHGSINVGWIGKNGAQLNYDPVALKAEGYHGIKFVGAGPGKTIVKCTSWDGITVAVGRHDFIVVLEGLTVHAGYAKGVSIGQQNTGRQRVPGFQVRMIDVEVVVLAPELLPRKQDGSMQRTTWAVFGYNVDLYCRNVVVRGAQANEHAFYLHGAAKLGWAFINTVIESAGAEGIKIRSDWTETAYAGNRVMLLVSDCMIRNWHQPHSWRGGAGIVVQGGACNIKIQRSILVGSLGLGDVQPNERSKCIMVSSEGLSYDIDSGRVDGTGFGNGWIIIDQVLCWGHSDVPWHNNIIRVDRNSGTQQAAKGVRIKNSGIYGHLMVVTANNVPAGKVLVEGTNTPAIAAFAASRLPSVDEEAKWPSSTGMIPLSKGIKR